MTRAFEMDLIDTGVEWINDDSFAFVIEGFDLVQVTGIQPDGTATIVVFDGTASSAILFTKPINIFAHRTQED
jgi:hypothetical protein